MVRKELGSECTTTSVRFSQAGHLTHGKPTRPSTMIAPTGHGGHEEELADLKVRMEEQMHKLRDTELEIEEAPSPGVHTEPRRIQQTLRDPLALEERVPDLRASQEAQPPTRVHRQR